MTEFHVEVVRLGEIESHPNADLLEITSGGGVTACFSCARGLCGEAREGSTVEATEVR